MSEALSEPAVVRPRRTILPKTRPGKIAIGFFVTFFAVFTVLVLIVATTGGHPWTAVFVPPLAITAFGGGIAAAIAVVRHRERGFLIILPVLVALVALFFVVGEFAVPH